MRFSFAAALLTLATVGAVAAPLFPPGVKSYAPVAVSAAAPNRQALLIVPAISGSGETLRGALAQSDAAAYRDLLRLLGFSVTVVAADTRPGLDVAVRTFAGRLTRDADVAVFVLGSSIEVDGKLFVPSSDLPPAERTRERIATQGLDVADILRRVVDRGPREVVAIVDECGGGEPNPACTIGNATIPGSVSAIVVNRVARGSGDRGPLAAVASARLDLLALMKEPDLSFLKLYARLKDRLDGTNVALVTTAALSRNFVFLPLDFFEKLPTECNRIDAGTSADALKAMPSVAPSVTACQSAAETWSFSPFFKDKLEVAREQLAFQKAVASCDPGAASAYLDRYPSGSYRFAVTERKAECDRRNQPPPAPEPPPPPPPPPAPPPPPPPPQPSVASLTDRAYAAIVTYYVRHSLRSGLNLDSLSEIYAPTFDRYGTRVSRAAHIRDLANFYAKYADFDPRIVPGSLDYSGCQTESYCLVRGSMEATKRKVSDTTYSSSRADFSVRFDLRNGIQVTYECSRVQGQPGRVRQCE